MVILRALLRLVISWPLETYLGKTKLLFSGGSTFDCFANQATPKVRVACSNCRFFFETMALNAILKRPFGDWVLIMASRYFALKFIANLRNCPFYTHTPTALKSVHLVGCETCNWPTASCTFGRVDLCLARICWTWCLRFLNCHGSLCVFFRKSLLTFSNCLNKVWLPKAFKQVPCCPFGISENK